MEQRRVEKELLTLSAVRSSFPLDCQTNPNFSSSLPGTGTEICYSLTDVPFCCDILTGYFHSSSTEGNIYTGDYTLNDGQEGNLFRGPYPTPTSAATSKTAEDVSTTVSRSVTFLGSATVSRTADATGVSGTGSKVAESTSVATETEAATSSAGGSGSGSGSVSSAPSSASTPGAGVKLSKPNGTVLAFLLGLLFL